MPSDFSDLRVFVSSTSEDLQEYRAVVRHVILDLKWRPTMMEHFGALSERTVDAVHSEIGKCDLMILVVAFRRGWVPPVEKGGNAIDSITALELAFARSKGIPILAMLASETWPGNLWEEDAEARRWVKRFREELNLPAMFFDAEPVTTRESERLPGFRAKVREMLLGHQTRLLAAQVPSVHASDSLGSEFFATARDGLFDGTEVPFLGSGVYGDDPPGYGQLARALSGDTSRNQVTPLATAAEYRERLVGSREIFMASFRKAVEQHSVGAAESPVYELLVRLARLPLIVSTVYDQVLEKRFEAAGIPFVVIAHILKSSGGEHDGRILVLRSGQPPEIVLADRVEIRDGEHIIYKPLGSPFLHDRLDAEHGIDTVVVTEEDHLTFLGRLQNQHTRIPTVITRLLRGRPLLFLGYHLDVWQYRLVMQVFQSIGNRGKSPILAVRTPESPIEEVTWKRLGAGLIPMKTEEFAKRVMASDQSASTAGALSWPPPSLRTQA